MITQFKTLNDITELIKEYETVLMRPTLSLSHPTLYRKRDAGKKEQIIKGVRVKDWFLSEDHKWVKPHDQMGLSFSASIANLSLVYDMKKRFNPKKLSIYIGLLRRRIFRMDLNLFLIRITRNTTFLPLQN